MSDVPRVSVLTAVMDPVEEFLLDSYRDLCAQNVDWEWVLQFDAAHGEAPGRILDDPRVSAAANGRWLGVAITRNRALARSRARYVYAHDYDDRLAPEAFAALLEPLETNPDLAWAAGRFDDLVSVDGRWETRPCKHALPLGKVPAGEWSRISQEHRPSGRPGMSPLPAPTSLMWNADWLLAFGGWGALSSGEDAFMVGAIQEVADGFCVDAQVGWYRKHPSQFTAAGAAGVDGSDYVMHRDLIDRRVAAIRRLRLHARA